MTLRKKTLLMIGMTLLSLVVLLYVISQAILLQSFRQLEEQVLAQNVQRALNALTDDLTVLQRVAIDWAWWDDTYEFIVSPDEAYIESNLLDESFTTLQLNLVLFINNAGEAVFSKAFDLRSEQEVPVSPNIERLISANSFLLSYDENTPISGIILLPEGPMLTLSLPILNSEETGASRGTMIWGRHLDSGEIQHLAEVTRLSLTMHPFYDPQIPADFQVARDTLGEENLIFIQPLDGQTLAGYTLINDVYGDPALILRIDTPRNIYVQGQNTLTYLMLSILLAGIAFGGIALLWLEKLVLSRLVKLSASVETIGANADLSARVSETGRDELGSLAEEINHMLNALEDAQITLHETEAAEREQRMMAETLHDTAADLTSTLDLDEVLELILTNVEDIVPHDAASVMLVDDGVAYIAGARGYKERGLHNFGQSLRFPVDEASDLREMTTTKQPIVIASTSSYPEWVQIPELAWVRSYVGAPICLETGTIGFLGLVSDRPEAFTQAHAKRLQVFSTQAAVAIQNAQLYESERYERRLAQTLQQTTRALASPFGLDETLAVIVNQLGEVLEYDRVVVILAEAALYIATAHGFDDPTQILNQNYPIDDFPIFYAVMTESESLLLADAQTDPRWVGLTADETRTRGWLGVPLIVRDVTTGILSISSDSPNVYSPRDAEAVTVFAQHAALAIENARILLELESSLTDLHRAQTHLARAVRLSAAGEIAAGVAHQINNPLTSVIAEAYLLLKRLPSDSPNYAAAYESAVAIKEAAHRAGEVVQRFMDLARTTPYSMELLDINLAMHNAISLVRSQIEPHGTRLVVEMTPEPLPVEASEQHLEDVWINLLLNARDAVKTVADAEIKVTTALNHEEDMIEIVVQDNGVGIPAEQRAAIFDAFFTTKEYGTGLGLSICHDVIERHGGVIRVQSEESKGTKFIVNLPVYKGDISALKAWTTVKFP